MSKLRNIIILCAFVLWILPLGVYIKPAEEKKICGGQRAICLCTKMMKLDADAGKKVVLVHVNSLKEPTPSSGYGESFLELAYRQADCLMSSQYLKSPISLYSLSVSRTIEQVPKV